MKNEEVLSESEYRRRLLEFEERKLSLAEEQIAATRENTRAIEAQRTAATPALTAGDPSTLISRVRAESRANPHDVREIHGRLKLRDGSHGNFHGSGSVVGEVEARVSYDYTKCQIINVQYSSNVFVEYLVRLFDEAEAEAIAASADSLEHRASIEKQRMQFVRAGHHFRCRVAVLRAMTGKPLDHEDVRLIFTPHENPALEAAAE